MNEREPLTPMPLIGLHCPAKGVQLIACLKQPTPTTLSSNSAECLSSHASLPCLGIEDTEFAAARFKFMPDTWCMQRLLICCVSVSRCHGQDTQVHRCVHTYGVEVCHADRPSGPFWCGGAMLQMTDDRTAYRAAKVNFAVTPERVTSAIPGATGPSCNVRQFGMNRCLVILICASIISCP